MDAREGGHQQEGLGEGAPVAVEPADGVGEPAQEASGAGPAEDPLAVGPLLGPAPGGAVVLAGAGRSADADPGHVDLVDLLEAAGGVGGEHARQTGGETGAGHDRQPLGPGLGVELEEAGDVVGRVGHGHDRRPRRQRHLGQGPVVAGGPGEDDRRRRAPDGAEDRLEVGADRDRPPEGRDHRLPAGGVGIDHGQVVDRAEGEELAGGPGPDRPHTDDDGPHQWRSGPESSRHPPRWGLADLPPRNPDGGGGQSGEGHGQEGASFHDGGASWNRTSDLTLIRGAL